MNININGINIIIDEYTAFRILCTALDMDCVLDENKEYLVDKDEYDNNCVYIIKAGQKYKFDDRGNLFAALRNVAANIIPNTGFRDAEYIQK